MFTFGNLWFFSNLSSALSFYGAFLLHWNCIEHSNVYTHNVYHVLVSIKVNPNGHSYLMWILFVFKTNLKGFENNLHSYSWFNLWWPIFCLPYQWELNNLFVWSFSSQSSIWRCHHCRWRALTFDLCSVLMAIKQ